MPDMWPIHCRASRLTTAFGIIHTPFPLDCQHCVHDIRRLLVQTSSIVYILVIYISTDSTLLLYTRQGSRTGTSCMRLFVLCFPFGVSLFWQMINLTKRIKTKKHIASAMYNLSTRCAQCWTQHQKQLILIEWKTVRKQIKAIFILFSLCFSNVLFFLFLIFKFPVYLYSCLIKLCASTSFLVCSVFLYFFAHVFRNRESFSVSTKCVAFSPFGL